MDQERKTYTRKQDAGNQTTSEFLKRRQVCKRIGYEKSWLWDAIKHGRFPSPISVGGSKRWVGEQVEQWMRDQIERNQSGREA